MKIVVNGQEETRDFAGANLGDLLQDILDKNTLEGHSAARLRINDQDLPVDQETTYQTPVASIETLEVEFSSLARLLDKNISNAEDYLSRLIPAIGETAGLFRAGSEQEASRLFVHIIDGIEWLSEVTEMVAAALAGDAGEKVYDGETLKERQARLINLSEDMLKANKQRDWVELADLLDYELLPYYKEWAGLWPRLRSRA